jgi:hypothetical protein
MTKHEAIIAALTPIQRTVIMSAGSNKIGAACSDGRERRALATLGVLGPNGGLTVTGSIVRELMTLADEEKLFAL